MNETPNSVSLPRSLTWTSLFETIIYSTSAESPVPLPESKFISGRKGLVVSENHKNRKPKISVRI